VSREFIGLEEPQQQQGLAETEDFSV